MSLINIIVNGFAGVPTKTLVLPPSESTSSLWTLLQERLNTPKDTRLILTTTSNKQLLHDSDAPISTYLSSSDDDFLPLRLSVPVCGGKGGFGSQLRAAGGRMSSRKKRNQGDDNASSRNLDGRRLRTVTEAKALAEYLAVKPDMDRKEKERKRKRWEQVVEMADRRQEEIKNGKGRLDGKWVEAKEDSLEMTRHAVASAMKSIYPDNPAEASSGSASSGDDDDMDGDGAPAASSSKPPKPAVSASVAKPSAKALKFAGFDEDDEFMSADEDA
jgi:hypothetical protein